MLPLAAATGRRRSTRWRLVIVALAAGVFLSPTLYLSGAPAVPGKTTAATPSEKEGASAGAAVRVELAGGAVYEFVGVAEHPSRGGPWWAADGAPIAAPYDAHPGSVRENPPKQLREFVVRKVKPGERGAIVLWSVRPNGSSSGGRPRDVKGNAIAGLESLAQALPGDATTCSVRFESAAGEWQTEAETDGQETGSMGNQKYSFGFAPAAHRDGQLVLSIAHNVLDKDLRIVAIDLEGREITTGDTSSVGGRGFLQTTSSFAGLELKDVKEFQLQSRSYAIVEIQNISLDPATRTQPKVVEIKDQARSR